jgi:hypothetical protein
MFLFSLCVCVCMYSSHIFPFEKCNVICMYYDEYDIVDAKALFMRKDNVHFTVTCSEPNFNVW